MNKIIIVGGGGTGISAIAFLLKELGFDNIIVIDSSESQVTKLLSKEGIKVIIGHAKYQIDDKDFIIYSDAAKKSPEVSQRVQISKQNPNIKPPISFFQFLGIISQFFKTIAISGTHGKSTTTAMTIWGTYNLSPKFGLGILGAFTNFKNKKNYIINPNIKNELYDIFKYIITGKGRYLSTRLIKRYRFIVEADEFDRHFLRLHPYISGITNIEIDHTDTYPTHEQYFQAFKDFINRTEAKTYILPPLPQPLLKLNNIYPIKKLKKFNFKFIFGEHNNKNANLAAKLIKHTTFASMKKIVETLNNFPGLRRRQEYIGSFQNKKIFSDYAHHPTEIYATIKAFKDFFPKQKIAVIFQPHQGRRIIEFWNEFKPSLKLSDEILIYPIYHARENIQSLKKEFELLKRLKISSFEELSKNFAQSVGGKYIQADYSPKDILEQITSPVVIILSAGNIDWKFRKFLNS